MSVSGYYTCMNKHLFPVLLILLVFFSSCVSSPDTKPQDATGNGSSGSVADVPANRTNGKTIDMMKDDDVVVRFDNVAITKKAYVNTKSEIELVVDDLNKITLDRDYTRWLAYTSEEYRNVFSGREVLDQVSASLPTKGIRLRSLQDYFNYVFVPSRQNMRVDDIQFVTPTRVYVIMEITPSSPAAIYILEKTTEGWKLVPKNS